MSTTLRFLGHVDKVHLISSPGGSVGGRTFTYDITYCDGDRELKVRDAPPIGIALRWCRT